MKKISTSLLLCLIAFVPIMAKTKVLKTSIVEKKLFLVSDESVNAYGFRVLTKGIDLKDFKRNPVGYYNHERYQMPSILWEEVTKQEDGTLTAVPRIDTDDELGRRVASKIEKGFLRSASIGIEILATSDEPTLMVAGQTRGTVTKSRLIEISVVDIPANRNAVRLYKADPSTGKLALLSAQPEDIDKELPLLCLNNPPIMKNLLKKLGLEENATEEAALEAVEKLTKTDTTTGMETSLQAALNRIEALETQRQTVDVRIAEILKTFSRGGQQSSNGEDRSAWNLSDWEENDPEGLVKMSRENPEKLIALAETYKGRKF